MESESGLTFFEVLIMVAVLAVVAAITVPRFKLMLFESREGRTKASLGDLRGALAIYYSDNYGLYPSDEGKPESRLSSVLVPQYLKGMPVVELTHHHAKKRITKWTTVRVLDGVLEQTFDGAEALGLECDHDAAAGDDFGGGTEGLGAQLRLVFTGQEYRRVHGLVDE